MGTAADWKKVMNLSNGTISDTNAEYVIDQAIDELNLWNANLTNLAGVAGSKTTTLTSKARGGLFKVARMIYMDYYTRKGTLSAGLGAMSHVTIDYTSKPHIEELIRKIAKQIQIDSYSRIPFVVAEDTTGYT